mgnify:FL=1|tara:strand:+ start:534 stop:725 length:192 start_codon:yes stop_codon:yes gene_type:complete
MTDGPLKRAFDLLDSDGVLSRELTTMRIKDGMLVKEVVTRKYSNHDYTDGIQITPICKVEGEK